MLPLLLLLLGLEVRTVIGMPQFTVASPSSASNQGFELEYYGTTQTTEALPRLPRPEMYSLRVESRIISRYARTVVSSRLANPADKSQEVFFSVVLPETAFISGFLMEVDGKVYEAFVREKEEAKHVYEQAVTSGQAAAHVALSARDSNHFTVSVNVEPQKKVTFNLTYEELLSRRLGLYNHVINLQPGQEVQDLQVQVFISESRNITLLQVPELHSGNEIDPDQYKKVNSIAKTERPSSTEARILFSPSVEEQRELAKKSADKKQAGLSGQFVVQYDVDRDPQAGEVLVSDGYFVHFFAPTTLKPLHKHVIFVLDVSGSMEGRKIEQLKEAMKAILDDLSDGDYFNIIEFSYSVTVWNLDSTSQSAVFSPYNAYGDNSETQLGHTPAFPATEEYKTKAKDIIKKMRAGGGTNIDDTLRTAIRVAHDGLQNVTIKEKPEPIIVFLTDGEPTVGEVDPKRIQATVKELNFGPEVSIFSLALGDDADMSFLNRLSLRNSGFARKIYEASDTALQLRDFYRQVASPLLANVTFSYQPEYVDKQSMTQHTFPMLFSGGELIVAGKLKKHVLPDSMSGHVIGSSLDGASTFSSSGVAKASSLERLWAYLTVQQLMEKHDLQGEDDANSTESKDSMRKALQLALKYSFVTPVTSLVVVKPNSTQTVESEAIHPEVNEGGPPHVLSLAAVFPIKSTSAGPSGVGGTVDRFGISGTVIHSQARPQPEYHEFVNIYGDIQSFAMEPPPEEQELITIQPSESPNYLTTRVQNRTPAMTTQINKELVTDELLDSVSDLEWLSKITNGSDILLLPLGENGTAITFRLGINETAIDGTTCVTSAYPEGGVCVPLPQCVLRVFKQDLDIYLKQYFCQSDSLAGVCCPDHLYGQKTVTTEKTYDTTTVVEEVPKH